MARKKLTLSVDEEVVRKAKRFSERHGTSLSRLVTDFFARLVGREGAGTRIVSRLRGILPPETDLEEYHRHIEARHRR